MTLHSRLRQLLVASVTISTLATGLQVQVPTAAATPVKAAAERQDPADSDGDGVPDRPDTVSAALAARALDKRVEDLSQRTSTTQVFANADGTWTTESYAGPVRVQDAESGDWSAIDTALEEAKGRWRPATTLTDLTLSDGGSGPLAVMRDVDGRDLSWSWPTALPKPTVDGSTLTYHDAIPGGDLVVEALPGGFSHSVVLNERPTEALELPMLVETDGATLATDDDGALTISARRDDLVTSPPPVMWDSTDGETGQPATVPVDTAVDDAGSRTSVVLSPDSDYLSDPDTVYPVTIDPSYTVTGSSSAWINTMDWQWSMLIVGAENSGANVHRSLIDFEGLTIPAGGVAAATLSVYSDAASDCDPMALKVQRVTSSWDAMSVNWATQPTVTTAGETTVTQTAKGAGASCADTGWDNYDITSIAQAWASGATKYGVRLSAAAETGSSWRNYRSTYDTSDPTLLPKISITDSATPGTAVMPTPSDSQAWGGSTYVRTQTPAWTTSAVDPDLSTVRYTVEVHASASGASPVLASCTTGYVASGTASACTPSTPLANGTYFVRAAADDGQTTGSWSPWRQATVNYDQPEPPAITCPSTQDGRWYTTRPASTTTCTFNSPGAVQLEWSTNGTSQTPLSTATGSVAAPTIGIPTSGWVSLKVRGVSNSGLASTWSTYSFGTGSASLITPAEWASSTTSFRIQAAAPAGMDSAELQWRPGTTGAWKTATETFSATGATWDHGVQDSGTMSTTPTITWRPTAESGMQVPSAVQVRVHFLDGSTSYDTQGTSLNVLAHMVGLAAPDIELGPGTVQLGTGEFQMTATDVSIGAMAVTRSHLSNANPVTGGATSVFGPGWSASLGSGDAAAFAITDNRATSASLLVTTPAGTTYTYQSNSPAASNLTGSFEPVGDAKALGATVEIDSTTGKLRYADSGTVTTFVNEGTRWSPVSTTGTGANSTTSYYYNSSGLPTWIIAPAPAGVSCDPSSLPAGCQALHFGYTTVAGAARVDNIAYHAWDPNLTDSDGDVGSDGLPDSGATVTATVVRKYTYDSSGFLTAAWDPRIGDGASALKTTYTYVQVWGRTRVTSVTSPGFKKWQINYDDDGGVSTITRQQDAAVGSGNATWTVKYGLKLNAEGDGLPNLSAAKTAAWGQPAADAPDTGAAVFGPDRVPATTPTVDDWQYAGLYYWNSLGRLTNTASYSNGWQISSTRYDAVGNAIWSLAPDGKAAAISDGAGNAANSAVAADRYASWQRYNADGSRVEVAYGPTITADTNSATGLNLRSITQYVYDDEADPSLTPGRPTSGLPPGGFNLPAEVRKSATDETTPGTWAISQTTPPAPVHLYDTIKTRFRYDAAVTGDPSGWTLRQKTATLVQNGSGWDKTVYRYNSEGQLTEERSAVGVASGLQSRWQDTVYYSADASSSRTECRNKPAWDGFPCWQGPAAQPTSGQAMPTASFQGYSLDGQATRVVTTAGAATRTEVATFDAAGRMTRTRVDQAGAGTETITTNIGYSTTNGLPLTTSNGTMTVTNGYDSWGRVVSQNDGAGNTTTTSYDTAGHVATRNDGKGTYQYGYNETNPDTGVVERRGVATSVNVGISGVTTPMRADYDAIGRVVSQTYPGASQLGDYATYDLAGNQTQRWQLTFNPLGWAGGASTFDVNGRMRSTSDMTRTIKYGYDDRGRLATVVDNGGTNNCYTRSYALTADSDRTSLTAYGPSSAGACQSSASGVTTSNTYDDAGRLTNAGYTYDALGRTTTVPAAGTLYAPGGNVSASYHANDMVATLSQGGKSQTFTLDPFGRISTTKNLSGGVSLVETTNHYADTSDSPAWTETKTRPNASTAWTVTWTRYVQGLDGKLAIIQSSSGTPAAATYNTHGDLVGSIDLGAIYWNGYEYFDEFGATRGGGMGTQRYGWLGEYQRDTQGLAGISLMGQRLYNPATGRFLSLDPVAGGNENAYVYPTDPVNVFDPSGCASCGKKDYYTQYYDTSTQTISGYYAGSVWLYKALSVISKAMSYVSWTPGISVEVIGQRYRWGYYTVTYRSCEYGTWWWAQYYYKVYYPEEHIRIYAHVGPFEKTIKTFWMNDPTYWGKTEAYGFKRWKA